MTIHKAATLPTKPAPASSVKDSWTTAPAGASLPETPTPTVAVQKPPVAATKKPTATAVARGRQFIGEPGPRQAQVVETPKVPVVPPEAKPARFFDDKAWTAEEESDYALIGRLTLLAHRLDMTPAQLVTDMRMMVDAWDDLMADSK